MTLVLTPLGGIPLIQAGDDLPALILESLRSNGLELHDADIVVVGQKIVSKAEGRLVNLQDVSAGKEARELARQTGKDPRLVELILGESRRVVRAQFGTIIVEHRLGFICANAGIDHSNVAPPTGDNPENVLLLPVDPDESARRIRLALEASSRRRVGVIIIDSHGRPWRLGTVGVSIGLSGVPPLLDERGWTDLFGYRLQSTVVGVADELSAAASLVMGQAAEGTPVVHVRGFPYPLQDGKFAEMIRPAQQDLFR